MKTSFSTKITKDQRLGTEGYRLKKTKKGVKIEAATSAGLMYGKYELQRLEATGQIDTLREKTSVPAFSLRILNHWDNLDGTVERGYAGHSLWKWEQLPDTLSPRYEKYAQLCASIGINGTVLNNVNASPKILSDEYIDKVSAIANVLRQYGIRTYLSVNFASPIVLGGLPTADPLDEDVKAWWRATVDKIYAKIPDFGGFLVKANSEGQPGPCDYGRSHAEGANMLARVLRGHGGLVMWRAFVYSAGDADRAKQAYIEFQPLDGQFDDNVVIQIKNGPIDFQPREPYSPLFGAMPQTAQMVEFQITQEYLGHSNHLAYLAPMWSEFFDYVNPKTLKAVAGVANVGDTDNYTGHPFGQANWYAFGRLAWDPTLTPEQIAREWARMTVYTDENHPQAVEDELVTMMCKSREAVVNYMMPLGLHHLFAWGHHYGPEPWCDIEGARPDWMPKYYHRADSVGLGFDRSTTGSGASQQYPKPFAAEVDNLQTCPDEFVLWFHHVPWSHRLQSGNTLWNELCYRYDLGVKQVAQEMIPAWEHQRSYVKSHLWSDVNDRLSVQLKDAKWWKDACLLYFQQFSQQPIPENVDKPTHTLEQLKQVKLPITNYECPSPQLLDSQR
jgi:alpha-glucuronidase